MKKINAAIGSAVIAGITFSIMPAAQAAEGFQAFAAETAALAELIKCPEGSASVTTTPGMPDLWGCILPGAEVLKVFVNEGDKDQVANVMVMWNDWTRDAGYGLHTDKAMAEAWVAAIATRYAPEQVDAVLTAFRSEADMTIDAGGFTLAYSYYQGPAIAERLIRIEEK